MPETIQLITSDKIEISALLENTGGQKAAILLHMMPATKESWGPTMEALAKLGYSSIAIDQRGHGQSTMNGKLDHESFSDSAQQAKIHDVIAANTYLLSQGFTQENIVLIGASIGANLAIQFQGMAPEISISIALSPGMNYRGVMADKAMEQVSGKQHVVLAASSEDSYSYESVKQLHDLNEEQTTLLLQSDLGHGTTMLERDPLLLEEILSYLP